VKPHQIIKTPPAIRLRSACGWVSADDYPRWAVSHGLFEAPETEAPETGKIIRNFLFTLLAQQSGNR